MGADVDPDARQRAGEIVRDQRVGDGRVDRDACGPVICMTSTDARPGRHGATVPAASRTRHPDLRRLEHDEAAAADVFLANQIEPGLRLLVRRHDDVLEQIAEAGFDGALVLRLDFEIIGDRALLTDVPVGLRQHHAGGVGIAGARLLRDPSATRDGRTVPPAPARAPEGCSTSTRARCARVASSVSRAVFACSDASAASLRAAQAIRRRCAIVFEPLLLHPDVGLFHAELGELLGHALRGFLGVLDRVPQRGRHVQRRKHLRPRRLDVGLEPLDAPVLVGVFAIRCGSARRRRAAGPAGLRRGALPLGQQQAGRARAALRVPQLGANLIGARSERRDLLAVELDLLLATVDVELARVDGLARTGGGVPPASTSEMRTRLKSASAAATAAAAAVSRIARVRQPRAQRFDSLRRLADSARRTAAFPSGAARRAAACSGGPSPTDASAIRTASRARK